MWLIGCAEIPRAGPPLQVGDGILFRLFSPGAAQVSLAGSFNNWKPETSRLRKVSPDGLWEIVVPLPPGRYQYMFLVDGKWITPPNAPQLADDGFGRQNGLIVVK